MFKLEEKDAVTKQIASIGRAGARLIAAIQTAAVQVIGHAVKFGDVSLANALIDSTPKHQRASLIAFLEAFGPFAYRKADKDVAFYDKNKTLKEAKIARGEDLTQEYVDKLPRWESMVKPQEPRSVYDVSVEADRFLTRMRKLSQDAQMTVKHKQLLDDLTAAYNKYSARLVLGEAADTAVGENVQFQKPELVANQK